MSANTLTPPPRVSERAFQAVLWGGLAIAAIFFAFRIYVRIKSFKRLFVDDALVLFAWLVLLANAIVWQYALKGLYTLLNVQAGLEIPPADFVQQVEQYLRLSGAIIVMFYTSLWAVKLSFLVFFRRLGHNVKNQKILWWSVTVVVVLGYLATLGTIQWWCLTPSFTTILVKCTTKSAVDWERSTLKANCVIDIFTDILIMTVPLHMLWKVQISKTQKLVLAGIFSLAIFIIVIAIVRVAVLLASTKYQADGSWLYLWSSVEQTISMIIASLAAVRALFTRQQTPRYTPDYRNGGQTPLNKPSPTGGWLRGTYGSSGTLKNPTIRLQEHSKAKSKLSKNSSISQENILPIEVEEREQHIMV